MSGGEHRTSTGCRQMKELKVSNHAEGPANWKIPVGPLSEDDADLRWRWLTPAEHQRFEELADIDIEAYLELSSRI